ncbi:glycerate kinase [Caldicoprobacter algeriensis]|uniref:glycerate kinase family protein n=1 Tax=Caldicoprobacter algeriensis TaxID=699281 RepID=UPI00207A60E2|nr:glycerate kinase [Caldicoprobacter algeriensis]MCM8900748.1 glycerate kinase [Caldicoprobacter algeriensis]
MKIVLAPDSFKGTFSSLEVIEHLEEVAKRHFSPLEVIKVPIADGGEGTVDALVTAAKGEYRTVEVMGPLPEMRVKAKYGIIHGRTAVIEMAQASGLPLIPAGKRDPLNATTYGTGEIIKSALDEGIRDFIIGIGGSATNDGGIGAAQALGVKFLDRWGKEVGRGGKQLQFIDRIILDDIDPRIKESNITVICDVSNPLTGPDGATAVYGPQKGVTEETFDILESGMKNYERLIKETTGMDMSKIPGSGAAGGLGAALVAFFGAVLKPGIETVLDYVKFDELIEGADLVITGEGRIDGQSVYGKVPVGIAKRCSIKGIKVVAIVGGMGPGAQKVYDYGIYGIMPTVNAPMLLDEAVERAEELLKDAADRMFRFIKLGMKLKQRESGKSQKI